MAQVVKMATVTKKTGTEMIQPRRVLSDRARRLPPMDDAQVTQLFQAHDARVALPLAA